MDSGRLGDLNGPAVVKKRQLGYLRVALRGVLGVEHHVRGEGASSHGRWRRGAFSAGTGGHGRARRWPATYNVTGILQSNTCGAGLGGHCMARFAVRS
jgi:hypothetical protein